MIAFVHGVPETRAIWYPLRELLSEDSVALELPGFGGPRPDGFGATKDEYAAAIVEQLKKLDGPIDLVGQDWGGLLTMRVATAHPELVRSWVADCAYCFHPDYAWHPWAEEWVTPGLGERQLEEDGVLKAFGTINEILRLRVSEETASEIIAMQDDTMQWCILDLYRSAMPNIYADWGDDAKRSRPAPGLVLVTALDSEGSGPGQKLDREFAEMLDAKVEPLDTGHWWMLEDPDVVAEKLQHFWDSISGQMERA